MRKRNNAWAGAISLGAMVFTVISGGDARGERQARDAMPARAAEIPVDPVVEEPLRSLGLDAPESPPDSTFTECGAMNGFVLPVGVLAASGLGWIPLCRSRRGTTA